MPHEPGHPAPPTGKNLADFLQRGPNPNQTLRRGITGGQNRVSQLPGFDQIAQFPGIQASANIAGFGGQALPVGLNNLLQILMGQGRTSPDLLNAQLGDISRGTQAAQTGLEGNLARLGLQRSGVGAALGAATGQAGEEQRRRAIAEENALAENRQREDLGLLLNLILNPSLDLASIGAGIGQSRADRAQRRTAARNEAATNVAGSLLQL